MLNDNLSVMTLEERCAILTDANARLIAAAPELLRALNWMVLRAEEAGYPDGKCLEEARAAIAKATGDQQ